MALRVRGETVEELTGAVTAMRDKMLAVQAPEGAIDIVGTGGDSSGTYNVSTLAAIIAAACGVPSPSMATAPPHRNPARRMRSRCSASSSGSSRRRWRPACARPVWDSCSRPPIMPPCAMSRRCGLNSHAHDFSICSAALQSRQCQTPHDRRVRRSWLEPMAQVLRRSARPCVVRARGRWPR